MSDEQQNPTNAPEPTPVPTTQDQLEQLEQTSPAESEPDTVSIPVDNRSTAASQSPVEPVVPETPQPFDIEPPTQNTPTTPPVTPNVPKKHGKRVLLIILIIVLLVIVAGLTVYALKYSKPEVKPVKQAQTTSSTNTDPDPAKTLVDNAKKQIADKYSANNPNLKITRKDKDASPEYKPAGIEFYLSDNIGSSLLIDTTGNDTLSKQIISTIADYLTSQSLTGKTVSAWDEYQNDAVICTTSVKTDKDFSEPLFLSCANKSAYDAPAASLQPFVNALRTSSAAPVEFRSDTVALAGPVVIKDSRTSGYQTASVGVNSYPLPAGGSEGMFYRKSGDWQFFAATQGELPCSAYNTDDLKNAYAGEPCGDASGNASSTVQPAGAIITPNTQTKTQTQTTTPTTKSQSTTNSPTTIQP